MTKLLVTMIVVLLAATGCATVQEGKVADPQSLSDVAQNVKADFAVDLDAAIDIANEGQDEEGMLCFPALKEAFGTARPTLTQVRGLLSAYERVRVTRKGFTGAGNVPSTLKIACAPLLMDERLFLIKLGVLTGGAVSTGGAALPLLKMLPLLP